jgi:hypothetical protein
VDNQTGQAPRPWTMGCAARLRAHVDTAVANTVCFAVDSHHCEKRQRCAGRQGTTRRRESGGLRVMVPNVFSVNNNLTIAADNKK